MSWAGIASNQCVSRNNLQDAVNTGVFTLKNTIPAGTKQITKNEAAYYVNINTAYSPFAAKASNQLVVKSNLQAAVLLPYSYVIYYNYQGSIGSLVYFAGFTTSSAACSSITYWRTLYSNSEVLGTGTVFYDDPEGTSLVRFTSYDNSSAEIYFKIDTEYITFQNNYETGYGYTVQSIGACSVTAYSYSVRLDDTSPSFVCSQPSVTVYASYPEFTEGIALYYDSGLTNPVTGYFYVVFIGTGAIYSIEPTSGIVQSNTGLSC